MEGVEEFLVGDNIDGCVDLHYSVDFPLIETKLLLDYDKQLWPIMAVCDVYQSWLQSVH